MKKSFGKKVLAVLLAGALALPLIGCGGIKSKDLMKDIEKSAGNDMDCTQDIGVTEYNHETTLDFSVRLLQNSMASTPEEEKGENVLISPISILAALAMTANGAKGETLTQMEQVFGVNMDNLNEEISAYITSSNQLKEIQLNIANSIWFKNDDSLMVNQDFLQKNADYYEASVYAADFDESTLEDINRWVDENTDGMIKEILKQIPADAVMYLINAVAFDAKWQEQYTEDAIHEKVFTKEDGTKQTVEFMFSEENIYLESENATGFMKNYKGGDYAFVAILPNEGITIEEYIASLDGESLYELLSNREKTVVNTFTPKFETEYDIELSKALEAMGMVDVFYGNKADLTGIGTSNVGNLFVSRVLHKTYICVDENGTKAGAATAVEIECESAMDESPKQVHLDRPFVYMIMDTETYKPLFIGTMMSVEE